MYSTNHFYYFFIIGFIKPRLEKIIAGAILTRCGLVRASQKQYGGDKL